MSSDRQLNYVNNLQNRDQNLYYVDDASELNSINLEENDKIYAINDNKLFQMEIADREEELSGSIVSFNGRNNTKIKSLVANIEPQQDLHGYDYPWPAGGSTNKFGGDRLIDDALTTYALPSVTKISDTSMSIGAYGGTNIAKLYDFDFNPDTRYTLIIKASNNFTGAFPFVFVFTDGTNQWMNANTNGLSVTTSTAGKSIDYLGIRQTGMMTYLDQSKTGLFQGVVTADQFHSYSNICPISGWTGAEIEQRRKNLTSDDIWSLSSVSRKTHGTPLIALKDFLNGLSEGTYTVSVDMRVDAVADSTKRWSFGFWGQGISIDSYLHATNPAVGSSFRPSFTITKTTSNKITSLYIYASSNTNGDLATVSNWQIEKSSTATPYEPYHGSQISVTFPSEAGTVYGARITLNPDRTGALVVDRAIYTPIISNVISRDNAMQATCGTIAPNNSIPYNAQDICTEAKYSVSAYPGNFYGTGTNFVLFGDKSLDTKEKWEAYVAENNYQICYVLATPITYTLTESEISGILTTLYGTNNIWANAGDITVKIAEKGITTFELKPYT